MVPVLDHQGCRSPQGYLVADPADEFNLVFFDLLPVTPAKASLPLA